MKQIKQIFWRVKVRPSWRNKSSQNLSKTLNQNKMPRFEVVFITGHKNEVGFGAYESSDEEQQRAVSLILTTAISLNVEKSS